MNERKLGSRHPSRALCFVNRKAYMECNERCVLLKPIMMTRGGVIVTLTIIDLLLLPSVRRFN